MSLPDVFKIRGLNRLAQTVDFSGASTAILTGKFYRITPANVFEYSAELTLITVNTSLTEGQAQEQEFDNTTDKWEGVYLFGRVDCTVAGAGGVFDFRVESATNGTGGLYPSDAANFDEIEDTDLLISVPIGGVEERARNRHWSD